MYLLHLLLSTYCLPFPLSNSSCGLLVFRFVCHVSLHSSSWLGTCYVDHSDLDLAPILLLCPESHESCLWSCLLLNRKETVTKRGIPTLNLKTSFPEVPIPFCFIAFKTSNKKSQSFPPKLSLPAAGLHRPRVTLSAEGSESALWPSLLFRTPIRSCQLVLRLTVVILSALKTKQQGNN